MSADRAFIKFFPLERRHGQLFLFLKEKVAKRSRQPCRLNAGEHGDYVPQSRRSSSQTPALRAELFARRKGVAPLAVLWGAPIVWRLFFWCAYRISAPPKAYFSPAVCCEIVLFLCSTEFSLSSSQKPIGGKIRRWEYSKPPRGTHLLPYARASHESCRGEPMRFSSAWFAR